MQYKEWESRKWQGVGSEGMEKKKKKNVPESPLYAYSPRLSPPFVMFRAFVGTIWLRV